MADCKAGALPLECLPACRLLLAEKGYNSDVIRRQIEATEAALNIPPKANGRWKPCFSLVFYRGSNAIERMFGRFKDFRRIATRLTTAWPQLPHGSLPRRNRQLLVVSPEPTGAGRSREVSANRAQTGESYHDGRTRVLGAAAPP